jgi:serine/threonine protein kinase/tetratricopeptide (TPR) repeat protein
MIGENIAQYRITGELGRGGMGVVYLAEDTRLDCQRALKFLSASVTPDSPEHTRLVNEARALAALEHPNICPVQEIGEHEGRTFIVMSFLDGRTLKDRLEEGPLPLGEALEITRQVAAALAAAHAKGVVHRDVKPDNVMLVGGGNQTGSPPRAVMMDFGIAKIRDNTLVTRTGTVLGTMAYMSPEQAQGERVDAATDVWATGVMLYEMLKGERPFQGEIEPAVLYAIVHSDPEPLSGAGLRVPEQVERLIGKALAKDCAERYPDAGQLATDLERAAAGESIRGRSLGKSRRGRWTRIAAAVGAAILAALFVWPGFLLQSGTISALAVMPLEDRSPAADQIHFAEGIADDLASGLNRIGSLTVVARSSAAKAREMYETNREIGSILGVDALIEGSIQRIGDQVKVSVQMVATDDDRLLWSDSYTRDLRDILKLQGEIATAISVALEAELSPQEQEALTREDEVDPEAYEEYLLARHFASLATPDGIKKAIGHIGVALAKEPHFAQAHIFMAQIQPLRIQMLELDPREMEDEVRRLVDKAMEMAPHQALAHGFKAEVAWLLEWDLAAADDHYRRAREIDPGWHNMGYAQFLNLMERHQEALEEAQQVVRLDPLNTFYQPNLAARYYLAGQEEAALEVISRLHERDPDNWISHWLLGNIYAARGDMNRAVEAFQTAVEESEESSVVKPALAVALIKVGRASEAEAILADLEKQAETKYVAPTYLAQIYAGFGRMDDAFDALERAIQGSDDNIFWIQTYSLTPADKIITEDPRWSDLARRIGLP